MGGGDEGGWKKLFARALTHILLTIEQIFHLIYMPFTDENRKREEREGVRERR